MKRRVGSRGWLQSAGSSSSSSSPHLYDVSTLGWDTDMLQAPGEGRGWVKL